MSKNNQKYTELMIVGNGFDLNHGLETKYEDFVKASRDSDVLYELEEMYNKYNVYYKNGTDTWSNFEQLIESLQMNIWNAYMEYFNDEYLNEVKLINNLFRKLVEEFYSYISRVNEQKITRKQNIDKIFTANSIALSFNYTSFVKQYTSNVYYVHGSIDEDNEIILGMLNDEMSDIADFETRQFCKYNGRELLNFKRFLKEKKVCKAEFQELLSTFMKHLKMLDSGKGGYDIPVNENGEYDFFGVPDLIQEYGKRYKFSRFLLTEDVYLEEIEKVYILGHSLESDLSYLKDIFGRLDNVKEVYLFSYKEEKECEISKKKKQLSNFFNENQMRVLHY